LATASEGEADGLAARRLGDLTRAGGRVRARRPRRGGTLHPHAEPRLRQRQGRLPAQPPSSLSLSPYGSRYVARMTAVIAVALCAVATSPRTPVRRDKAARLPCFLAPAPAQSFVLGARLQVTGRRVPQWPRRAVRGAARLPARASAEDPGPTNQQAREQGQQSSDEGTSQSGSAQTPIDAAGQPGLGRALEEAEEAAETVRLGDVVVSLGKEPVAPGEKTEDASTENAGENPRAAAVGALAWMWSALKSAIAPGGFFWGMGVGVALSAFLVLYPFEGTVENALREKVTLFDYILQDINQGYVDKVDINRMFETGVNGMLATLDPYTQFENNAEASEMHVKTSGKYGGVGLGISSGEVLDPQRAATGGKNRVVVVSAFEGYAFDAGVRPGDVIDAIGGSPTDGLSIAAVTDLLRGEPGTSVDITVLREGAASPLAFTLTRRNIQLRDVPVATFVGPAENSIGYLRLQSFAKDAASEVSTALQSLIDQAKANAPARGLRGIVLDLRGNPGGLLNAAIEVAETIVPRGSIIVSTKGRDMGPGPVYMSNRDPVLPQDIPIAVLVNGQTASASEIVAGAVQDLDRGVIIGTRTFGKGLVQNVQELPYQTALKFTVGRYFTPSGRCIQALKYDSKDANGHFEAKAVDESDRKEFLTRRGRIVRDGGGIEPDVMSKHRTSFLESALARQNMFFHFAGRYAGLSKLDKLPSGFEVTDTMYNDFIRFVTNSQFKYESRFDEAFEQLEGMFNDVGYEAARGKVNDLRKATEAEMRADFIRHELDIRAQLESSIRFRYQPESERLVAELRNDEQLREAVRVLQSPLEYAEMLAPRHAVASISGPNAVASSAGVSTDALALPPRGESRSTHE
jgi:carboxyl-terminal processing protease